MTEKFVFGIESSIDIPYLKNNVNMLQVLVEVMDQIGTLRSFSSTSLCSPWIEIGTR